MTDEKTNNQLYQQSGNEQTTPIIIRRFVDMSLLVTFHLNSAEMGYIMLNERHLSLFIIVVVRRLVATSPTVAMWHLVAVLITDSAGWLIVSTHT